jgi:uncharacterized integral membrane protein
MLRLVLTVVGTIALVTFAMSNSHHVGLSVVLGAPVRIRLVFLLLVTFFVGMSIPLFYSTVKHMRASQRRKRAKKMAAKRSQAGPPPDSLWPEEPHGGTAWRR